jgi:hypothetical protein
MRFSGSYKKQWIREFKEYRDSDSSERFFIEIRLIDVDKEELL